METSRADFCFGMRRPTAQQKAMALRLALVTGSQAEEQAGLSWLSGRGRERRKELGAEDRTWPRRIRRI